MRQESTFVTLLRLFGILGICFFLGMLYWSSTLVEQDLIDLKSELRVLKTEISDLSISSAPATSNSSEGVLASKIERKWDDKYPNLLEEDLYMTKTLPSLLPKGFRPQGTRHDAGYGKPDNLHPLSGWANVTPLLRMTGVSVARGKTGFYESLSFDMALKMEQRSPTEFWIHLREGVHWQPLEKSWFPAGFDLNPEFQKPHPVTAHDYKFYFDAVSNPNVSEPGAVAQRTLYAFLESVTVLDDYTFVVKWKKDIYISKLLTGGMSPLPRFVYQYFSDGKKIIEDDNKPDTYATNPIWALNFSNHWAKNVIVGCGGWYFDGMSDRMISLKRNPHHYFKNEVLTSRFESEIRSSPEVLWQDFKEAKTDFYALTPQQTLEFEQFLKSPIYKQQVAEGKEIKKIEYVGSSYSYIGWNQANPLFASRKVRQALTMGIDRERIIRQTLNGQGVPVHGPFSVTSTSNNPNIQPWGFDPQKAKRMLAEEGWYDSDGDGIIDKDINGVKVPFRFALTYYVKNTNSKAIVEYVAGALLNLGIKVDLNGVEVADLSKLFEDKSFDALFLAWSLGSPPEETRQLWESGEADKKGSSNAFGFRNKEIDSLINQLDVEKDPQKRLALYYRFDEVIHEEQPYTFLYAPKNIMLYRAWVQNVFIPSERQDLIPGANIAVPDTGSMWLTEEAP